MVTVTVRSMFREVALRDATLRYCEACWGGWKEGKAKTLADRSNPFVGGPQDLIAKGVTSVTMPGGTVVEVGRLTRLRLRQLDVASLKTVGDATGKDLVAIHAGASADTDVRARDKVLGQDVVHPEYVPTFDVNISNDPRHFTNNAVAASAVIDAAVSYVATDDMAVEDFANLLEAAVDGKRPDVALVLAVASRTSWLGRACTDGSWKDSGDFVFAQNLGQHTAALDQYVAVPVLKMFIADLRAGYFTKGA